MARGTRWQALRDHLEIEMSRQGIGGGPHDPDFILGAVMAWLDRNDCAMTGEAVRPFRRRFTPHSGVPVAKAKAPRKATKATTKKAGRPRAR
jgi:hypothetical protein